MRRPLPLGLILLFAIPAPAQSPVDGAEQTVESHLALAEMQIADGETLEAEGSIQNALDLLDDPGNRRLERLIDVYLALGDAYRAAEEHEFAIGAYANAQDVSRRAFGLYNPRQIEILQKMADSVEAVGDSAAAVSLYREAISLIFREFGSRSVEATEATLGFADWLSEHGHYGTAARQYRSAVRQVPYGEPSERVRLLTRSAENNFLEATEPPRSTINPRRPRDLVDALELVQPGLAEIPRGYSIDGFQYSSSAACIEIDPYFLQRNPVDQPLLAAEILRGIGDWCIVFGVPQFFGNAHEAAWDLLALTEDGEQIREEWFATPAVLFMPPLSHRALSREPDAAIGYVELSFIVEENGTARKIEVVNSNPAGLLDRPAKRRISNARFRPSIEDGQIVASPGVFAFEFSYDPESMK
jgi:TonB family protein